MQAGAVSRFVETYKYGLPFLVLFLTSFFLPAASHRVVFYLCVPFIGYFLYSFKNEIGNFLKTRSFYFLAAYLGYFLASAAWSSPFSGEEICDKVVAVAGITIFTLGFAVLLDKIPYTDKSPFYFAFICAIFAIVSGLVFYFPDFQFDTRLEGLGRYQNSIHFSFLLSYGILALFCMKMQGYKNDNALLYGIILLLVIFIALSQTRSSYIALAACMGLIAVLGHVRAVLFFAIASASIAFVCYGVWDYASELLFSRLDGERFGIWREAWAGFLERPWLGHGILTEPKFYIESIDPKSGWKSTHNILLGHAYVGGLIGLSISLLLMGNMAFIAVRQYLKERRSKLVQNYLTLATCLMIAFCFCVSLFNFTHYIVNVHIQWLVFWVPFALCWHMEVLQQPEEGTAHA